MKQTTKRTKVVYRNSTNFEVLYTLKSGTLSYEQIKADIHCNEGTLKNSIRNLRNNEFISENKNNGKFYKLRKAGIEALNKAQNRKITLKPGKTQPAQIALNPGKNGTVIETELYGCEITNNGKESFYIFDKAIVYGNGNFTISQIGNRKKQAYIIHPEEVVEINADRKFYIKSPRLLKPNKYKKKVITIRSNMPILNLAPMEISLSEIKFNLETEFTSNLPRKSRLNFGREFIENINSRLGINNKWDCYTLLKNFRNEKTEISYPEIHYENLARFDNQFSDIVINGISLTEKNTSYATQRAKFSHVDSNGYLNDKTEILIYNNANNPNFIMSQSKEHGCLAFNKADNIKLFVFVEKFDNIFQIFDSEIAQRDSHTLWFANKSKNIKLHFMVNEKGMDYNTNLASKILLNSVFGSQNSIGIFNASEFEYMQLFNLYLKVVEYFDKQKNAPFEFADAYQKLTVICTEKQLEILDRMIIYIAKKQGIIRENELQYTVEQVKNKLFNIETVPALISRRGDNIYQRINKNFIA